MLRQSIQLRRGLAVLASCVLAACGGGGGSDGAAPVAAPPPPPSLPPPPPPSSLPPPVVAAVNVHGQPPAGGGQVLFAGSGLDHVVEVTFGGAPASGLTYEPLLGAITVVAPPSPLGPNGDGFVELLVRSADGQTATVPGFHYGQPPVATGFTPGTGQKGDVLTISGAGFSADAAGPRAGLQVAVGGVIAPILSKTPTEIAVTVPKLNPGVYQLSVVNFDGQYSVPAGAFTVPGP